MITIQSMKTPGKIFAIACCTLIAAPVYSSSISDTYASGDTLTAANMDNIKTAVNDNDTNTASNTADIATNASDIATNTAAAATNATAIAAKADASAVTTNAADIATNVTAIGINATAISGKADASAVTTNAAGIATNVTAIATNATAIAGKADASAATTNASGIATNVTAIATNATAIAGKADSSAVTTEIATAIAGKADSTDVTANTADIATNTADIATNVTDIATNATGIATNATDIATNVTDIATNVTGIATNATAITTLQAANTCPSDMVAAGTLCVDKYEASVYSDVSLTTIIAGANINTACLPDGSDCSVGAANPIYAGSVAGVIPSFDITYYQAAIACANVGKRLPTISEWQMAAAGTPAGLGDGTTGCNGSNSLNNTGLPGATCQSTAGAFDMVGNVFELTADLVFPAGTIGATDTLTDTDTARVVALGDDYNGAGALHSIKSAVVTGPGDTGNNTTGFRCVK